MIDIGDADDRHTDKLAGRKRASQMDRVREAQQRLTDRQTYLVTDRERHADSHKRDMLTGTRGTC